MVSYFVGILRVYTPMTNHIVICDVQLVYVLADHYHGVS